MNVIKRNGQEVDFDINKIKTAVKKASEATEKQSLTDVEINDLAEYIEFKSKKHNRSLTVEEIQDMVESQIMAFGAFEIAKNYVKYRYQRELARNEYEELMKDVSEKLTAENVQNQNANLDEHSFGGRIGETTNLIMKRYALEYCMSEMSKNNHLNNEIYIHDLDHYAVGCHNCLTIPFDKLLKDGFNTRQTDVRPAQSISTAMQLIAVIFQLQSLQQFGGVSASHLDWTAVPYIRKSLLKHYILEYLKDIDDFYNLNILEMSEEELDNWVSDNKSIYLKKFNLKEEDFCIGNKKLDKKLYQRALFETRKETYQSVEAMYHNLNTLQSRSGNQLPFSSVNYGTCTLPEGRMLIKALLEVSIKGIGKMHKTSIFPCGIFQVMSGVNKEKDTPNYDLYRLALKSTATRLYPNYANVDWSGNKGYDRNDPKTYFSTMGCRTANGYDINGFGQLKDGRGNICPVTIILPTLAMEAKQPHIYGPLDDDEAVTVFMKILDKKIHEAKDMLIERFEWICKQDPASAKFMYENEIMAGYVKNEGIRSALKHGTLAIGNIGLAETLEILIGENHVHPKGMALAQKIYSLFQKRCSEFKEKYKLNFGVYNTPAENLCFTAMNKFKNKYGIIPKISDKEFFTNSMHVPVWEEVDIFTKIDIESQLTGYSSAGCITYVELDSGAKNNIDALETIVNYAMDHDIPYFALNVPNDTCLACGYTDEFNVTCPVCSSENIQHLRRVTGYLTGDYKSAFNLGKQAEVELRYKHKKFI